MKTKTVEVELPVCLECDPPRVGHTPNMQRNMRSLCTGPAAAPHKRRKMVYFTFRMVTDGVSWPE